MSDETTPAEVPNTTQTPTAENDSPKFSERLRALKSTATGDRLDAVLDVLIADAEEFGF